MSAQPKGPAEKTFDNVVGGLGIIWNFLTKDPPRAPAAIVRAEPEPDPDAIEVIDVDGEER
jgi:hypothetical protein